MSKNLEQTAIACGIDFGTSNSTVGWCRPGQSTLLPLEVDKPTLPSVIFFHADDGHASYGRAALADYLEGHEGRMMRSLKSLLGTSMMDGHTEMGGRALPFRDLLGMFIGELKRRAEHAADREFTQAVLGRPVFFVDDDVRADQRHRLVPGIVRMQVIAGIECRLDEGRASGIAHHSVEVDHTVERGALADPFVHGLALLLLGCIVVAR